MEVTLLTISKLCASILHKCTLELDQNVIIVSELRDKIYDIYPTLDEKDYTVYWWYNKDCFHKVWDYITYFTAISLMAEKILLLVLMDSEDGSEENESFLHELDIGELKEAKRRMKKDPYDICRKVDSMEGLDVGLPFKLRTDSEILSYALRKYPEPKYFTSDLTFRMSCAQCIKKGKSAVVVV
uniref:Uncharacterized protein n=1 Tax=Photinus pyralis TaxID=7054 RepID=A0A1Y1LDI9_PHOPY